MKTKIILFLAIFSLFSQAESFSQLAKSTISMQFHHTLNDLKLELNGSASPASVKQLRKDLGLLKIHLDMFGLCYKKSKKNDFWLSTRELLDQGYEQVGFFKDLNDTFDAEEVTEELIKKRRDLALAWKTQFLKFIEKNRIENYFNSPQKTKNTIREDEVLAKFFWRNIDYRPSCNSNGDKVIKKLFSELMVVSSQKLDHVLELKNLLKHSREEEFHDFRKQVRSLLKLIEVYPENFKTLDTSKVSTIDSMIGEFGDLNDLLVKMHHSSGSKKEDIEDRVKDGWKDLKKWLIENNIKQVLLDISNI